MQQRFVIPALVFIVALAMSERAVRSQTADPGDALVLITFETGSPSDDTRLDALTFNQTMAYLEHSRPRVLYLALDETERGPPGGRQTHPLGATGHR